MNANTNLLLNYINYNIRGWPAWFRETIPTGIYFLIASLVFEYAEILSI